MAQDCAGWHDDLGAYILGVLDAEDSAAVRWHLAGCARCRADCEHLLPVRDWLASTRQHLVTCRICQANYQGLLQLQPLPAGPQPMEAGDAPVSPMPGHFPRPRRPT
jgi:anti-sigma factor RsiW